MINVREFHEAMKEANAMMPTIAEIAESIRQSSQEFRRCAPSLEDLAKALAWRKPAK